MKTRNSPRSHQDTKRNGRNLTCFSGSLAASCKLSAVSFRVLPLALALVLSATCDLNPEPDFRSVINVHSLLNPAWVSPDENPCFVNRTYRMTEQPDSLLWDAAVLVWRSADTWRFTAGRLDSVWAYFPDRDIAVAPFDTFSLMVAKPGLDTVFGSTFVPDTFSLIAPLPGDTITVRDSLIWKRSRHSAGYYFSLRQQFQGREFDVSGTVPNESIPGLPYDTLVGRIPLFFLSQQPAGPCTLRLMALDINYYEYVRSGGFRGGQSESRLTGGIGVFGSGIEREVAVYLKQDTSGFCSNPRPLESKTASSLAAPLNPHFEQQVVEPGFRPVRVPGDQ